MLEESNRIIENTIRQIRETQAEKEKTKEVRQKLEDYKKEIIQKEENVIPDNKLQELSEKARKIIRKTKTVKQDNEKTEVSTLKPGDAIKLPDIDIIGEAVEIKDDMVTVETGSFRLQVSVDKVIRISKSEYKKSLRKEMPVVVTDPLISERKLRFQPEIDIRGSRGDEALEKVRNLIDDAVMVNHKNLRILHGKGNGILRELVRNYLSTLDVVKSFHDEHVEMGGAGITVVELDF